MSTDVKLGLPSVAVVAAIVAAGAFAAGRASAPPGSTVSSTAPITAAADPPSEIASPMPRSAPPIPDNATTADLPSGHPSIEPGGSGMALPGVAPRADGGAGAESPSLAWKTPARWQSVPNASSMRLATYKIPRAPGDSADAEMSVMQAGGTVDANVQRWIGQFDGEGQKTAKRTTKKVGALEVTLVEVEGTFNGGMGMGPATGAQAGWALLAAIVATPDMPHFFKMTGPVKSVKAARAELDALVASFASR